MNAELTCCGCVNDTFILLVESRLSLVLGLGNGSQALV